MGKHFVNSFKSKKLEEIINNNKYSKDGYTQRLQLTIICVTDSAMNSFLSKMAVLLEVMENFKMSLNPR